MSAFRHDIEPIGVAPDLLSREMNQLYPIIRRKRRPLLPVDAEPSPIGTTPPAPPDVDAPPVAVPEPAAERRIEEIAPPPERVPARNGKGRAKSHA